MFLAFKPQLSEICRLPDSPVHNSREKHAMVKPIIFLVDDELQVLNAIQRDLRQHFRSDYRLMRSTSGLSLGCPAPAEGAQRARGPVSGGPAHAPDQRHGVSDPGPAALSHARKVLLTAYANTEAAISSINDIGLDHYLTKPWDRRNRNFILSWTIYLAIGGRPSHHPMMVFVWPAPSGPPLRIWSKIFWPATVFPICGRTSSPTARLSGWWKPPSRPPRRSG